MLQWSVGQHHAEQWTIRSDGLRNAGIVTAFQEHDGTLQRLELTLFGFGHLTQSARLLHVCNHHRERLSLAVFATAQFSHCTRASCVTREMKTADTFDG